MPKWDNVVGVAVDLDGVPAPTVPVDALDLATEVVLTSVGAAASVFEQCEQPDAPSVCVLAPGASAPEVVALFRAGATDVLIEPPEGQDLDALVQRAAALCAARRAQVEATARDPLTGLYNHSHLQEILNREISRSEREGSSVSLLFIDVDHFKRVNDSLGHQVGDELLKQIAMLIERDYRTEDIKHRLGKGVSARYGGDEFAVVLPSTNKREAAVTGMRLRVFVERHNFGIPLLPPQTLSLGLASYPIDAKDRDPLIRAADLALNAAKRRGRNRLVPYSSAFETEAGQTSAPMTAEVVKRVVGIEEVIARRAVRCFYQPIVRPKDESTVAYEALCRPDHPMFPNPYVLFTTAETTGRVVELGRAVRHQLANDLASLPEDTSLFINLHPLELNPGLVVEACSGPLRAVADKIVFEVTESAEVRDMGRVRALMDELAAEGYRFAVDDLGAGYSGLNSLAMLRPDFIKLDMGLVRGLQDNPSKSRLIRHILDYAIDEGAMTIAEGVETQGELDAVLELGVPLVQGYFYAKPAPPWTKIEPGEK